MDHGTTGQTFFFVFYSRAASFSVLSLSPKSKLSISPCPIASLRTLGLRTRRHPDLVSGIRSVDAAHGRQTFRPNHIPSIISSFPVRLRPDASKFLIFSLLPWSLLVLARVIPLWRLPKAEQPRQEKGVGEEKRLGFSSSS
ncbi:hypothetical protein Zm00014a_037801 [Zea mays]|uniref:Uncharacterized protein n=1 Tax=Zea mays TaxID=4577 RepID=A0A3L6DV61_MAIZE|nr:hypothetical protein Zm00014a_037801 [Zea mays]